MKKTILLGMAFISLGASAQQKLTGLSSYFYDETGALTGNDSSAYVYNSWEGSLTSNEPKFAFDNPVFDWTFELPTARWDEENNYAGTPLQLNFNRQNTFLNGKLSESEIDQSQREVYTYDASGNVTKVEYFFWNVSQYEVFAEINYEYDANNNLTLESYISDPITNPTIESVDSLFYDASNNLTRSIYYLSAGSNLEAEFESLITYSGNEVDNIQLFENTGTQLEWTYDIYYTYTGGLPSSLEGFAVTGGVPDPNPEIEIEYTYNANNQLALYEGFFGGDLFNEQVYTYDAAGFVQTIEISDLDFATSAIYLSEVQNFYYQSTANTFEVPSITATVFPNPTSDFISIEVDAQIERISVVSADGKKMISQNENHVDVSQLTPGVYFIDVMTSAGSVKTSFVKK